MQLVASFFCDCKMCADWNSVLAHTPALLRKRAQVIRNYHGHLSGVYSLAQHPTIDVIMTGGRDAGALPLACMLKAHCA